jgi:hypothetical protein
MIRRRIDHLPVIEKERKGPLTLKGILTSNHVLEYMLPSLQKKLLVIIGALIAGGLGIVVVCAAPQVTHAGTNLN